MGVTTVEPVEHEPAAGKQAGQAPWADQAGQAPAGPAPAVSPGKRGRWRWGWLVFVAALALGAVAWVVGPGLLAGGGEAEDAYADLPVSFEANQGQADSQVRFLARTGSYSTFLTDDEVVVVPGASGDAEAEPTPVRMGFADSLEPEVDGVGQRRGTVNYLDRDDPADWVTGVPTYERVRYGEVYPGVDAVFRDDGDGRVAYDLEVAPGADPSAIALQFDGAEDVAIADNGDLVVSSEAGEWRHSAPVVYQQDGDTRQEVAGAFTLEGGDRVGFDLGDYDTSKPLVIDPVLSYSTYLSGLFSDEGFAVDVDDTGAAYITGQSGSDDFPTTGGAFQENQPSSGSNSAFVAKLSPDGDALEYATYLGGSGSDGGRGIAVDDAGAAHVTGVTSSDDFPTQGPIQGTRGGGQDAFVAKLRPDGSGLTYSTYLGGSGDDPASDLALDAAGAAHVTGETRSGDFPTTAGAFQAAHNGEVCPTDEDPARLCLDAYVTKVSPDGSALAYSTYLGGDADDTGNGVAVGDAGQAHVTGNTGSENFPTASAFQDTRPAEASAFVTKLAADGTALDYSTYLGGSTSTYLGTPSTTGEGIAVDADGAAYVTGDTSFDDHPTQNPLQAERAGESDAYVTKFTPDGSALDYSTYLGGPSSEAGADVAVDDAGAAYLTGFGSADGLPQVQPVARYSGNSDVIAAQLTPDGSALEYSTYLGSTAGDAGRGVAVHSGTGAAYFTGVAARFAPVNDDFPTTPGAFQTERAGESNEAFAARIDPGDADRPLVTGLNPRSGPAEGGTAVEITGTGFTDDAEVRFGDEPAADLLVESDTEIVALSPAGAGTVPVTVTTADGTSPANPRSHYEYAQGVWRETQDPEEPRYVHTATRLDDGRVLVAGGRASTGGPATATAEIYDPETDSWESTGSLNTPRFGHMAALLDDGRVLVSGGFAVGPPTNAQPVLDTAELYDPDTGEWTETDTLGERRGLHTATVLDDGDVLVAGGRTCDQPPPAECNFLDHTNSAELFDPDTETWSDTGSMALTRHTYPAVKLDDGRVLAIGGFGESGVGGTAEIYDPATGTWEAADDLNFPRSRAGAAVLGDGRALAIGGFPQPLNLVEAYDPGADNWANTDPMADGRWNHSVSPLPSGDVLAAGGGVGGIRTEVFDPDTDTWQSAGLMANGHGSSSSLGRTHTAVPLDNGEVLVTGNVDRPSASRYEQFPEAVATLHGSVAGTVTDADTGEAIEGATVSVDGEQATTDASGQYTVEGVAPGEYTVAADAEGYESASQAVTVEAEATTTADFALQPQPGSIQGTVTDADTGEAIEGATVSVDGEQATTDGSGQYTVEGVAPGEYTVVVDVGGYESASQNVTVEPGATTTVDFALAPQDGVPAVACPEGEVPEADFTDRDDIPEAHRSNVDCAAWRNIVSGFPDGTFRPALPVRRDQMATFIAGMLDAAGVDLPEPREERFDDVGAGTAHDEAVHRLAAAGIVLGGPVGLDENEYGPALRVRRDQMASFLLRANEFATGEDLSSQQQAFDDVPSGNVHFANVNGAAEANFARGFGDGSYRPALDVRRDQMSSFVIRVLEHLVEDTESAS